MIDSRPGALDRSDEIHTCFLRNLGSSYLVKVIETEGLDGKSKGECGEFACTGTSQSHPIVWPSGGHVLAIWMLKEGVFPDPFRNGSFVIPLSLSYISLSLTTSLWSPLSLPWSTFFLHPPPTGPPRSSWTCWTST